MAPIGDVVGTPGVFGLVVPVEGSVGGHVVR
jgi:hypothetical protein